MQLASSSRTQSSVRCVAAAHVVSCPARNHTVPIASLLLLRISSIASITLVRGRPNGQASNLRT